MSRSAAYRGLGAGLMELGAGMRQQQAETARERRENALLEMRRQYQLEDREWQQGRDEADREFRRQEADRADAIQFGRRRQERDEDWERGADERARQARMDEARIGLMDAQAERGTTGADPARWRELTLHEDRLIQQGKTPEEAYAEAMKLVYPERANWEQQQMVRERVNLVRSIRSGLQNEFDRQEMFSRYGIPDGTPPDEAVRIIFEAEWPAIESSVFGGNQSGDAGQMQPEPMPREQPGGLMDQPEPVSMGEGLGAIAREATDSGLLGEIGKAAFFPPWGAASQIKDQLSGFSVGWKRQGAERIQTDPDASPGSRNNPIPLNEITDQPQPGIFYLHPSGARVRWNAERNEWEEA